jgi:hypothetical protein
MADPYSFRSMRVLLKPPLTEAEIAVSDFDSRKHIVLQPPAGAKEGWKPPVDNAPEDERIEHEKASEPPARPEGEAPLGGRESAEGQARRRSGSTWAGSPPPGNVPPGESWQERKDREEREAKSGEETREQREARARGGVPAAHESPQDREARLQLEAKARQGAPPSTVPPSPSSPPPPPPPPPPVR